MPSPHRRGRVGLLALALLAGLAGSARAQGMPELGQVLEQVAAGWARGDAGGIVVHASAEGLALELRDGATGPLPSRQAGAALRRLFDMGETVDVLEGMSHIVGGQPARAFGELTWVVRPRGTREPERHTVFVALLQEEGRWRVTQIRLVR